MAAAGPAAVVRAAARRRKLELAGSAASCDASADRAGADQQRGRWDGAAVAWGRRRGKGAVALLRLCDCCEKTNRESLLDEYVTVVVFM